VVLCEQTCVKVDSQQDSHHEKKREIDDVFKTLDDVFKTVTRKKIFPWKSTVGRGITPRVWR
jgi:hypothetical protein